MTTAPEGYAITVHDPTGDSDDDVVERCTFSNRIAAEVLPDDPPTPAAQFLANHRAAPERLRRVSVRARSADGALVGIAGSTLDTQFNDNPDIAWIGLDVLPEHRRRGLGSALLATLLDTLEGWGRTRVFSETNERVPSGAAFARSLGAVAQQEMHLNHLVLDRVDRGVLEQWVADGPVRAAGYELVAWDGAVSDEHLDQWLAILQFINTMPRDGVERNDEVITVTHVRDREAQMAAAGIESWVLVARQVETGVFAGFHDIGFNPAEPETAYVGATVVHPDHRGHALGKWLKAAMTLRVLADKPDVTTIRTGNADSNDAMLGINRVMGYEPLISATTWEIAIADLRDRLPRA